MNKNVMKSAAFVLAASAIFFSTGCGGEAGNSTATLSFFFGVAMLLPASPPHQVEKKIALAARTKEADFTTFLFM